MAAYLRSLYHKAVPNALLGRLFGKVSTSASK